MLPPRNFFGGPFFRRSPLFFPFRSVVSYKRPESPGNYQKYMEEGERKMEDEYKEHHKKMKAHYKHKDPLEIIKTLCKIDKGQSSSDEDRKPPIEPSKQISPENAAQVLSKLSLDSAKQHTKPLKKKKVIICGNE
eukprot:TRINITY_DN4931_c0_g1_i3.p2 TRINITY_DN4931_c0_g1~~TRINITY_DN4931_c0_g1_i3.p2  ORF type:complete len:135 (-),score=31.54 TRINITY_DN4931_c0_g1_i3:186-590(-)